jgi:hypothetical protein
MPEPSTRAAPAPRRARPPGRGRLAALAALGALAILGGGATGAGVQVLDDFEAVSAAAGWEAAPADGVEMSLVPGPGYRGRGMRLAFDFHGHGGYAIARKRVALDLPENYEL